MALTLLRGVKTPLAYAGSNTGPQHRDQGDTVFEGGACTREGHSGSEREGNGGRLVSLVVASLWSFAVR